MSTFSGLSVIIPTVDETNAIVKTVEIIEKICNEKDIKEILIIHSLKSTEAHINSLKKLSESKPHLNIKVLPQPGKGLGDALFYGCRISTASHFFMIGADLENDTYELKNLLELAKKNPDTVITTSRKKRKDGLKNYSRLKHILSDMFDLLMKIFFRSRQTDITYAYQITPKKYFDEKYFGEDHSAFILELALLTDIKKLPFIEVPTGIAKRQEGISHSGVSYYMGFVKAAVKLFLKTKAGEFR